MRTIEEKNIMIAEFMGIKFKDDDEYINELKEMRQNGIYFEQGYMTSELKFHTSWDWLMPVVIYINVNTEHTFVIQAMDCYVYNVNNGEQVTQPSMKHQPSELINSVYETVIEFIEMYNQKN